MINEAIVTCIYKGCPWKEKLSNLYDHIQNCLFVVENPSTVFSSESRPYNWIYLNKELSLYFNGKRKAIDFGEASKFWLKLSNSQGNINSSYGYRIFYRPIYSEIELNELDTDLVHEYDNQWNFCKEQLINDKDTRQALMFVSGPDVQYHLKGLYPRPASQ